jgi:hypothetical protein
MAKPIQGKIVLHYQCPKCKANMVTEHTHPNEFEMIPPGEHWASNKKLKWEGQCPHCYHFCEVEI